MGKTPEEQERKPPTSQEQERKDELIAKGNISEMSNRLETSLPPPENCTSGEKEKETQEIYMVLPAFETQIGNNRAILKHYPCENIQNAIVPRSSDVRETTEPCENIQNAVVPRSSDVRETTEGQTELLASTVPIIEAQNSTVQNNSFSARASILLSFATMVAYSQAAWPRVVRAYGYVDLFVVFVDLIIKFQKWLERVMRHWRGDPPA